MRTSLLAHGRVDPRVRLSSKLRMPIAGHRHNRSFKPFDRRKEMNELLGIACVAEGQNHVARRDQAEIAVQALRRMEVHRKTSGAAQSGRDLLGDLSGFTDARGDNLSA